MANRTLQQKMRKLKRRHRYARFSGETSKFAKERATGIIGPDGKEVYVPVGKISLSKQVPKVPYGPNHERMQTYYQRVNKESFLEPLKLRSGSDMIKWLEQYTNLLNETPIQNRITLAHSTAGRLDLFFAQSAREWFFVELSYKQEYIRRSRIYETKQTALERLKNNRILWVEYLPKKPPE